MTLPATKSDAEVISIQSIRIETLLSRYPVHRLCKPGTANIEIRDKETNKLVWQVSHNSKYGEPGPLAYKLETLVINRKIDESRCPDIPSVLRLGSIREIAEMIDMGSNTTEVKKALKQNASAFIDAFLSYRDREKTLHTLEISGSRFILIFTGEHFPDGKKADAVYLILHDWYREVQNSVQTRPLDYDYLKRLSPAAQRLYELLSYQIYATLKHERPRARMIYSEFCQMAPQIRYFGYKRMHMQMKKIHEPHIANGYIENKIEFREITDHSGNVDWDILYIPGPKARAEHGLATKRILPPRPRRQRQLSLTLPAPEPVLATVSPPVKTSPPAAPVPPAAPPVAVTTQNAETQSLVEQLMAEGLGKNAAEQYAKDKPDECRRQLDHLPYVSEFKSTKGAFLRSAIEEGYGAPKGYAEAKAAEAARAKMEAKAIAAKARQNHEEVHQSAYNAYLGECLAQLESTTPNAYSAFCADEQRDREWHGHGPLSKKDYSLKLMAVFDEPDQRLKRFRRYVEKQAQDRKALPGILSFWEWDKQHNPEWFEG